MADFEYEGGPKSKLKDIAVDNPHKVRDKDMNDLTGYISQTRTQAEAAQSDADASQIDIDNHKGNLANPHSVTKAQVGLGNVDNTSDADKPISDTTQTALDLKADKADTGDKNDLDTDDKSTIVAGVNEVNQNTYQNASDIEKNRFILSTGSDAYAHAERGVTDSFSVERLIPLDLTIEENLTVPFMSTFGHGKGANKIGTAIPDIAEADFSIARNSVATFVNKRGFIEEAPAQVARFDWSSGEPRLLLEDEATNSITHSEDLTQSNWFRSNSRVTVSPNQTVSPDGNQNADAIMEVAVSEAGKTIQSNSVTSNGEVLNYMFFKKLNRPWVRFLMSDLTTGDLRIDFNFDTEETAFASSGTWTGVSFEIEEYINGWFRVCLAGIKASGTNVSCTVQLLDDNRNDNYLGDVSKGVYAWGAESGNNKGSYIKTTGTAETRSADVNVSTGDISSRINSGSFVFEVDLNYKSTHSVNRSITLYNDTIGNEKVYYQCSANQESVFLLKKIAGVTYQIGEYLIDIDANNNFKTLSSGVETVIKINNVIYDYNIGVPFAANALKRVALSREAGDSAFVGSIKDIAVDTAESFEPTATSLQEIKDLLKLNYKIYE